MKTSSEHDNGVKKIEVDIMAAFGSFWFRMVIVMTCFVYFLGKEVKEKSKGGRW